jgi:hypothetical protein
MERLNIWNGLDELAFYKNTIILELLERSQGEFPTSIANSHPHGSHGDFFSAACYRPSGFRPKIKVPGKGPLLV